MSWTVLMAIVFAVIAALCVGIWLGIRLIQKGKQIKFPSKWFNIFYALGSLVSFILILISIGLGSNSPLGHTLAQISLILFGITFLAIFVGIKFYSDCS